MALLGAWTLLLLPPPIAFATNVEPQIIEPVRREPEQMHAMPVPVRGWRHRDKKLHNARGMLAAGVIFTALCSAGAGLGLYSLVQERNRVYGQDTRDNVAAFTGLLSCTAGALALAITGAKRLKQRRGR